jgi:hypothetical protein
MEALARLFARGLEHAIVNRVRREGARWVKTRLYRGRFIITPGNVYLRWARAGFTMHTSPEAWAKYELGAYRALYGGDAAGEVSSRSIWTRHLEGESLKTRPTADALHAGGVELARAHATLVDGVPFSHGDLHLKNLLYDEAAKVAHIIDFETPHDDGLGAVERHADDLYVLVLDLLGTTSEDRSPELARALFDGYARAEVLAALRARLDVERAFLPRALQIVRSNYLRRGELRRRFDDLGRGLLTR